MLPIHALPTYLLACLSACPLKLCACVCEHRHLRGHPSADGRANYQLTAWLTASTVIDTAQSQFVDTLVATVGFTAADQVGPLFTGPEMTGHAQHGTKSAPARSSISPRLASAQDLHTSAIIDWSSLGPSGALLGSCVTPNPSTIHTADTHASPTRRASPDPCLHHMADPPRHARPLLKGLAGLLPPGPEASRRRPKLISDVASRGVMGRLVSDELNGILTSSSADPGVRLLVLAGPCKQPASPASPASTPVL